MQIKKQKKTKKKQKQKKNRTQFNVAIYSKSSIQKINNRWLKIWEKNALLNLINNKSDIDKIHLYPKDQYQFLINKRESTGLKHFNNPNAFIEYFNDMEGV